MTVMQRLLGASAVLRCPPALQQPSLHSFSTLAASSTNPSTKQLSRRAALGRQKQAARSARSNCTSEAQREQALRRFAEAGANPIVMTGFAFGNVLGEVAPDYPDTKFAIIDMVVDPPNVRSVVFNEHEGSYLVGMMAALKSETNTVGFIGGMDIPLIRKFACGYAQGVMAANPDAT